MPHELILQGFALACVATYSTILWRKADKDVLKLEQLVQQLHNRQRNLENRFQQMERRQ